MKTNVIPRIGRTALLGVALFGLAACNSAPKAASSTDTAAPRVLEYSGRGIATNTYEAALKAGIARVSIDADGALTVDLDGPDGFHSQVMHPGQQNQTVSEVQIPADGIFQIAINHVGKGDWRVVIDTTGTAAALPAVPSDTPETVPIAEPTATAEPVRPSDTPQPAPATAAAGNLFRFNGSGIAVHTYSVLLPAGVASFRISSIDAMGIDIGGPDGYYHQLLHPGSAAETAYKVQIPASGAYLLEINHMGASAWTVILEAAGAASAPTGAQPPAATVKPTDPSPAGLVYSGSGMSTQSYTASLRAGNAKFVVEAAGVLTVDIYGPNDFYYQVRHTGLSTVTTTNVAIPADGSYQIAINHVGNSSWKVTITQ